jgi:hypothetical protein
LTLTRDNTVIFGPRGVVEPFVPLKYLVAALITRQFLTQRQERLPSLECFAALARDNTVILDREVGGESSVSTVCCLLRLARDNRVILDRKEERSSSFYRAPF